MNRYIPGRKWWWIALALVALLATACSSSTTPPASTGTTTTTGGVVSFPDTPFTLRTPSFGSQEASTVKVLASGNPTLIIQFPLFPVSIKPLFPNATGLVTVIEGNPAISDFDTIIVDVQHMPPDVKFTFFLVELSGKPFGHAEYVGDVFTRGDGSGESIFHVITFEAFAADNRTPNVTSQDQSGTASGIQLEHAGMWFDGVSVARQVLHNPKIPGTPFDGGTTPLHAGPQAMTDGQTAPVI
jgi:ABC-type glycerol-3-phosphate transport system substrate-binding protein